MTVLFTRALAFVAVIVLSFSLVSCGGEDPQVVAARNAQNAYAKKLNEVQVEFTSNVSALGLDSTLSRKEYQLTLLKLQPLLTGLGDDLKAIKPPAGVASQHSSLSELAYDYNKVIANNAPDITAKNSDMAKEAIDTINEKAAKFSTDFADVITDINAKLAIPVQ